MTRYVGTAAAAVALLAGLVLAVPGGAAGRAAGGLTSLTLTSVGTAGPSTQAAIAADGRYAAFVSGAVSAVYLRDLVSGKTTLVSDAADGSATAPDISANGRLISYEQDGDVFVADGPTVHQATGNSGEPRYAQVVPCPAALGSGRVTPCGPRISADGTTLAYPAELTPVPPELSITALDSGVPLRGDMLDLTPYSPGDPYGFPGGGAAVRYTDVAASPIPFTGVAITEPPGFSAGEPFHLGHLTCTGTLSSGSSCTAIVSVDEDACDAFANTGPRLITGSLVTSSPIPAGQSVIELTALCDLTEQTSAVTTAYRTGTAASGCPAPPADLSLTAAPATTSDSAGAPLSDVGSAEASRPYVIWMPVSAPATADVSFAAANGDDCGIQLVNPATLKLADPLPTSAAAPCSEGEQLTPSPTESPSPSESPSPVPATSSPQLSALTASPSSCTAYLLINPGPVTADAAFLGTVSGSDLAPTAYITVQGVRHVILARHDPAATGNFAASPATVVSVASDGTELPDATEPSLSADGQYVGFAAPVPDGASEVWLHDIGWSAVRPGSTTMVSCLPQPHAGHCLAAPDADSPSLSGSGQQVAFATVGVAPGNGAVYVRSVRAGSTVLVSSSASGRGCDSPSYAPVITQDATAVAFVSQASGMANLCLSSAQGGKAEMVSASGTGFPAGTLVGLPSVDAIGRLVTFPASASLLPAAPAGSVYTFSRLPRLSPSPADAAFGRVFIDSGTRRGGVTVTDTGPGPGTVTGVSVTGPFQVTGDACEGTLLSAGNRCTVTVVFTPSAAGRDTGALTVTTEDDGEPPVSVTVHAAADVPAPQLSVSPGVATYGEAVQVTGTGFPPGRSIALTWNIGLGSATATATGSGTLSATMVIFPDDIIGPRTLLSAATAQVLATAAFLVQEPSTEPPFSSGSPP
ncbi:MAG: choice-of-anchor D domain-containing protein [Streptosporangiaceae bacterium]|jgi:hypothetical protein